MANKEFTAEQAEKAVAQYAKQYEIPLTEARTRMVGIAVSRINALRRHATKKAAEKPASKPAKKAAKPAAKPAKKAAAK